MKPDVLTWIDISTPEQSAQMLVRPRRKAMLGRVTRVGGGPEWDGGLFNKSGQYTPLLPKPFASLAIAKQMVEQAVERVKELRA